MHRHAPCGAGPGVKLAPSVYRDKLRNMGLTVRWMPAAPAAQAHCHVLFAGSCETEEVVDGETTIQIPAPTLDGQGGCTVTPLPGIR